MVRAKKHLGQHFLNSSEIAQRITDSITYPCPNIVEVGPGMGILTEFLLQKPSEIYVYEIDHESVEYLHKHFHSQHLHIKEGDFLQADLSTDIPGELVLCGNFPYNISTEIIFKTIENRPLIPQMVGMFQKEVAERICATHGSKTYGITSVLTQFYYEPEYLFTVDKHYFNPPPKVQSAVIRLNRKPTIPTVPYSLLRTIVKTAFNQRRKKLSNALKSLKIPESLENHKFLNLRAEQLSVNDFIELSQYWNE